MGAAALLLAAAAFAFPNEPGTHLLATGEIANPIALRSALCTGAQRVSVRFERTQSEGPKTTGRHTPQNFAQTAGVVFQIVGGKVGPDTTCMLAEESLLSGTTFVPVSRPRPNARCSTAEYPQFQADKGRPVVGCWLIAESTAGIRIALIEFSRHLTQALASLVVIDGPQRKYVDYPATFTGPGDDLWRADDGGNIHAEGFEVIFLLKRGTAHLLAIDWSGAEGSALSLHIAEGAGQFTQIVSDSWYRSPL